MKELNPQKLHVTFRGGISANELSLPRRYILTHSDLSGDLFLTIGSDYDQKQISGFYTRLMRDEVLAELKRDALDLALHVYCHVSGGSVFGGTRLRYEILHHHMRMVLEAFHYGDRELVTAHPELDQANVWVHFNSNHKRYDLVENWGLVQTYG
jgi:hypothetical protein